MCQNCETKPEMYDSYSSDKAANPVSNIAERLKIAGRVLNTGVEIITFVKVKGRYFAMSQSNAELMDTYLHTGDTAYLDHLTDEVNF